ncbi:hypothetical protein WISP_121264 [Willisornis vidua]|uniref:Uncharacterized protein n=1 Tax=Willisornis vidua TaxID=1566151 RepID=A0ABQ9CSJ1_9PASS|nr:hypothetical protein WISP_121264 [Willisornis vidua]
MPAGSMVDPQLTKAKPINNGGDTSRITDLSQEKSRGTTATAAKKRGVRIPERDNSADTKVSEVGRRKGASGARVDCPAAHGEDHAKTGSPPAAMEVYSGEDIHLQPMEGPTPEPVKPKRGLPPHGKPTLEQICWQDL